MAITMTVTNAALNLVRDNQTGAQATGQVYYTAAGGADGTLTTALTSGNPYTSLAVTALASALANGASVTISTVDGAHTQAVTLSAAAAVGATSISVTSFNANYSYPVGAGVNTTPTTGQVLLDNEIYRRALTSAVAGANPGEALWTLYVAPGDVNAQIFELGIFAGSAATSSPNTGVLIARCLYAHDHLSTESIQLVADSTF